MQQNEAAVKNLYTNTTNVAYSSPIPQVIEIVLLYLFVQVPKENMNFFHSFQCVADKNYQNGQIRRSIFNTSLGKWMFSRVSSPYLLSISMRSSSYSSKSTLNDILEVVPPESDALSPSDSLNILRDLHEAVRKSSPQTNTLYHVTNHPNFSILCQALKVSLPYFDEIKDQFDILVAMKDLSVPINSNIFNAILLSFHENVFKMSLHEIMLLDRILYSCEKSQMVNQLHQSLIERFNLKSSKSNMKLNYFSKMRRWLQFVDRNRYVIIDEVFDNMENCVATQYIDILTVREAMDMIILLANFGNRSEYIWPILDKAFDIWYKSTEVTMQMVEITLKILVRRHRFDHNVNRYQDSRFIQTCTRTAIANGDIDKSFVILKYLNQLVSIKHLPKYKNHYKIT